MFHSRITAIPCFLPRLFVVAALANSAFAADDNGDWPGSAQRAIESNHPGVTAMVSIGCGADANPRPFDEAEVDAHGQAIADEVERLLAGPLRPVRGLPECRLKQIHLPFDELPTRAQWERQAAGNDRPAYYARVVLERLDGGVQPPTSLPYTIQTWTFGDDLGMVFLPGEVVVDYSLRLKKELGADLWVTAYANDVPCYIASGRVISEGGYEVDGSMPTFDKPTRLAVETEELIVGAVHELLPERAKRASETSNEFGCRASQHPLDHLRGHESQLGLLRRRLCGDPKPGPAGRPGLQLAPSPDEGVGGLRCEPNIQCGFSDDAFVRAIRARPIRQLEVSLSPIPTETVIARHVVPQGP